MTTNRRPAGEKTRPLQVQTRAHEPRRRHDGVKRTPPIFYMRFFRIVQRVVDSSLVGAGVATAARSRLAGYFTAHWAFVHPWRASITLSRRWQRTRREHSTACVSYVGPRAVSRSAPGRRRGHGGMWTRLTGWTAGPVHRGRVCMLF